MHILILARDELQRIQGIKGELETARKELEMAQRKGDLARASELRYGVIPKLEQALPKEIPDEEEESNLQTGKEAKLLHEAVTPNDVAIVISKTTGIPVSAMLKGDRERLLHLEEELEGKVVGQEEAVRAVSNAVRLGRAGFSNPNRPIASFLFLGPTGVGKTELCKQLARVLFDSESALTRIDMSEYMEKFSVSRLIGAPPGYVGFDEGGQLTNAVRRKPYSVVLLDEFEKAHRDVSNLLLQVLDEGTLTDSQGVKVDFRNTIIIMTSNLGAEMLVGGDLDATISEDTREAVLCTVRRHFSPEFLNRIDEMILFNRLNRKDLGGIVEIRLKEVRERLSQKQVELEFSQKALDLICTRGYDPAYGARPLHRVIQREILNPLATRLISGELAPGSSALIDASKESILIKVHP